MANQSHIVSYEDARRASYARRRSAASSSRPSAGREASARSPYRGGDVSRYSRNSYRSGAYRPEPSRSESFRPEANRSKSPRFESHRSGALRPEVPRSETFLSKAFRSEAAFESRSRNRQSSLGSSRYEEEELREKSTRKLSFAEKAEERKRARSKARAERKFSQQYQPSGRGQSAGASDANGAGPRAAVSTVKAKRTAPKPLAAAAAVVSLCVVCACFFLYPTAQQYYVTVREHDRLQAEYQAVLDRNEALQSRLDSLSTEEGLRQYVHERYGWVSEGENAVVVQGLSDGTQNGLSDVAANVIPGSVQAPETWYSSTLDPLFGYER